MFIIIAGSRLSDCGVINWTKLHFKTRGGGYSHTLTIRVCAAQWGRDFEAPATGYPFQRRFLERGIKNCGSRLYLLLKIVADYEEAFI